MDERLVEQFRRIAGPDAVLHEPIQLLTYECDALPHLRETPALVVLPRIGGRGAGGRAAVRQGRSAVRRARTRHGALGWSAAGSGRCRHQPRQAQSRARHRHPEPPRHRGAGRHESGDHEAGRAVRLLLRARPIESAGVLDRRQRRRELRRRALSQVRLHRAPCPRRRSGSAERRAGADRQPAPGCSRSRPARAARSAAKARWPSSPR